MATVDEAPELSALMRTSFMSAYGHIAPHEKLERYQARVYAIPALQEALSLGEIEIWVARDPAGGAAGYVQISTRHSLVPVSARPAAIELQRCYLQPAFFGSGAADLMMVQAQARARALGAERMYLSVYSKAPRAQAFYRRHGFEIAAPVQFFLDDLAFDDWSMVCELLL